VIIEYLSTVRIVKEISVLCTIGLKSRWYLYQWDFDLNRYVNY
jgi:hypothetical protein